MTKPALESFSLGGRLALKLLELFKSAALILPAHRHQSLPHQFGTWFCSRVPNLRTAPFHFIGRQPIPAAVVAMPVRENDVAEPPAANAYGGNVVHGVASVVSTVTKPDDAAHCHRHSAVEAKALLHEKESSEIHSFELCRECSTEIKCTSARRCLCPVIAS